MGQEAVLQSCRAVLQPVWTRLMLLWVQNRAPFCSSHGAAPWDLPEVPVAQQVDSARGDFTVTLHCHGQGAGERLLEVNWYT